MAFGCIIEGPDQQALATNIGPLYDIMLQMVSNQNTNVRYAACWVLRKMIEHMGDFVFQSQEHVHNYFETLFKQIKDHSSIILQVGLIFKNMVEYACVHNMESVMRPYYDNIFNFYFSKLSDVELMKKNSLMIT